MKTLNKAILMVLSLVLVASSASALPLTSGGEDQIVRQRIALTLSLVEAHTRGKICETDAYTSEIVRNVGHQLSTHWKDARTRLLRTKIAANKGLAANVALRYVTGALKTDTASALTASLVGTRLYSPGEGAYGSTREVRFTSAREVLIRTLDIDTLKWNVAKGTWSVKVDDSGIELRIVNGADVRTYRMPYNELNGAQVEGYFTFGSDGQGALTTSPSECEA